MSAQLVVRSMGTEMRLIVICCHKFVVGFVVIIPSSWSSSPLSLCCPVCAAESGNWFELQKHLAEHQSDVFKNGFGTASMEKAQVRGGGLAGAGPAGSATGGGRGRQRSRFSSTTGRGAGHSVVSQRGRAEGVDRHRLQNLSCPLLGARGQGNGRGRSVLSRCSGRHQGQA